MDKLVVKKWEEIHEPMHMGQSPGAKYKQGRSPLPFILFTLKTTNKYTLMYAKGPTNNPSKIHQFYFYGCWARLLDFFFFSVAECVIKFFLQNFLKRREAFLTEWLMWMHESPIIIRKDWTNKNPSSNYLWKLLVQIVRYSVFSFFYYRENGFFIT